MSKKKRMNIGQIILPVVAAVLVIAAVVVITSVPKASNPEIESSNEPTYQENTNSDTNTEIATDGSITIYADDLSSDQVSFINVPGNSRIELVARLGDDGKAKVALGTCQSCNGAPGAFYTQEGEVLRCNNCGLTFPISVLDEPGGGCHPIMIDESAISYEGNDVQIDTQVLSTYEYLFSNVANH
ncbi:MAG: DUF2318 domain-containing protein [Clostridiales bacterium]|nr:DUF2318 domain-containing protein [Clostridiales bacterium]